MSRISPNTAYHSGEGDLTFRPLSCVALSTRWSDDHPGINDSKWRVGRRVTYEPLLEHLLGLDACAKASYDAGQKCQFLASFRIRIGSRCTKKPVHAALKSTLSIFDERVCFMRHRCSNSTYISSDVR